MADQATYEAVQGGALEDGATVVGATPGFHGNSGGAYPDTGTRASVQAGVDASTGASTSVAASAAGDLPRGLGTSEAGSSGGAAAHGLATDVLTFAGGIGLGAALMYFMDPTSGRRRRALVRDQMTHVAATAPGAARATRRDLANRSRGLVSRVKGRFADDAADDATIVARVRAELGRVVSHPGSIIVTASAGTVTISGPVLQSETEQLVAAVAGTRGVREVHSQLEVYDEIDSMSVPGLQGGIERMGTRFELAQENWTPAARLIAGTAGAVLAMLAGRRRDAIGTAVGLLGVGLTARAVTNLPLERRAAEMAADAAGPVREGMRPVTERVRDGASTVQERVMPLAAQVRERGGSLAERAGRLADAVTTRFTGMTEAARERAAELGDRVRGEPGAMGATTAEGPADVARPEGELDRAAMNPAPRPTTDHELGA